MPPKVNFNFYELDSDILDFLKKEGPLPFVTSGDGPTELGQLAWVDDEQTLAFRTTNNVNIELGEKLVFPVQNNTGVVIPKGTPVAYAGSIGNSGKIRVKAWNGSTDQPISFVGVAASDISNGGSGHAIHFGKIKGVNTNGFLAGSILYANPTGTGFTATPPTTTHVVAALCLTSANNGTLLVRPTIEKIHTWNDIGDKPTEFTPSAHSHEIADVNGLTEALANAGGSGWTDLTENIEYVLEAGKNYRSLVESCSVLLPTSDVATNSIIVLWAARGSITINNYEIALLSSNQPYSLAFDGSSWRLIPDVFTSYPIISDSGAKFIGNDSYPAGVFETTAGSTGALLVRFGALNEKHLSVTKDGSIVSSNSFNRIKLNFADVLQDIDVTFAERNGTVIVGDVVFESFAYAPSSNSFFNLIADANGYDGNVVRSTGANLSSITLSSSVTVSGNVLFSYDTDSADNHRASLGEYVLVTENPLSAFTTAVVTSTESVTLPAGSYEYTGSFYVTTNSTTAGVYGDLHCDVNPESTSTSFAARYSATGFNTNAINTITHQFFTNITNNKLVENSRDGSSNRSTIATNFEGNLVISQPTTIRFRVAQRNANDGVNAAILRARATATFRRIRSSTGGGSQEIPLPPSVSPVFLSEGEQLLLDDGRLVNILT
jgi:hypothetical protein